MFRVSNFDRTLDSATSHLHLEPDWPSILLICDAIRQNDVAPKQALTSIRKKMNSQNPHTALYALIVLESVVKNCGSPIHDEICTKENCEMFSNFIESTPHENVKAKMLELIQTWAFAFRSFDKYQAMKDTVTILKTKGHKFPKLKEADAMFTSETAPDWSDGKVCHRCRVAFSITVRKHHCRNCGQIFCGQCSSKSCRLPKFGIEREVRVCEGCFMALQTPAGTRVTSSSSTGSSANTANSDSDLPVEYLTSSLAQQPQSPPRKTEQELKEEEELELALALSQSEAEQQKNKQNTSFRTYHKSPTPDTQPAQPTQIATVPIDDNHVDPELAKYLNRDYWEQRKTAESPASPSAPSPMSQTSSIIPLKSGPDEIEIDEFSNNLKTQVEIFVNRMKSNSSRGRSISNDSSVQSLFMNMTSSHSRLLAYIKEMDDKRMWFEQLQDKLTQVKDSRAALDVLRQEYQEKLRRQAEEVERQRQLQMAYKLDVMRKKKQEYLQYQRQLALQRIQEQERELQMRQEQQKAYHMSGQNYQFMPSVAHQQSSPIHQAVPVYTTYGGYTNQMQPPPNGMQPPPNGMPPPPQQQQQQQQRLGSGNMPMELQSQIPPGVYNPTNMPMPQVPQMMNMPQHSSPQQQPLNLSNVPMQPGQTAMHMQQGQFLSGPAGQNTKANIESVIGHIPPPGSINPSTNQMIMGSGSLTVSSAQMPPPQQQQHNHHQHHHQQQQQQMPIGHQNMTVSGPSMPPMNQNIGQMPVNTGPPIQYPQSLPQNIAPSQNQSKSLASPQQAPPPVPAAPPTQSISEAAVNEPDSEVSTAELISFD